MNAISTQPTTAKVNISITHYPNPLNEDDEVFKLSSENWGVSEVMDECFDNEQIVIITSANKTIKNYLTNKQA